MQDGTCGKEHIQACKKLSVRGVETDHVPISDRGYGDRGHAQGCQKAPVGAHDGLEANKVSMRTTAAIAKAICLSFFVMVFIVADPGITQGHPTAYNVPKAENRDLRAVIY